MLSVLYIFKKSFSDICGKRLDINMIRIKYLILAVILLGSSNYLKSQTLTQTVRGTVIDAESKQALEGVTVVISKYPQLADITESKGRFKISGVPVGRHEIRFSLLGYNNNTIGNIEITSGKEVVLNIELTEKVYETAAVEITATQQKNLPNNEMATLSVRNFNSEETNRYAGSRGDPSRMASTTAGVSSGNDSRNDIIVRGNSPIGVLWRLEGIDIPSPNHFSAQGATGGPVSILNNNLLANSDFYTGAWPADYGTKNAAVFDLKLRNGNNEKREFTGQIGVNGIELGAEGPFNKGYNGSYLINYRYSTLDAFTAMGISFGVSGSPRYQDISWKINLPTEKIGVFNFWGIGGLSDIIINDDKRKQGDWSYTETGTNLVYGSGMSAAGISNTHYYNAKTFGKLTLSSTYAIFKITVDTLSDNRDKFNTYNSRSSDYQHHAQYLINSKINNKNLIRFLTTYTILSIDYKTKFYSNDYRIFIDLMKAKRNTNLLQSSVSWQYKFSDRLILNNGIHFQQLFLNNNYAIEPRSGIKWQFKENQSLNIAYGLHNQIQPLINYFNETYIPKSNSYVQNNLNMGFTQSNHFVMSYDNFISRNFRLKLESYLQLLSKVPVNRGHPDYFSMLNQGNDIAGLAIIDTLVNKGLGKNYGIELTLEKIFSNNYYLLFTGSLFDSYFRGSNMIWHHTAFSGNYVGNLLGGYELPLQEGKHKLSFDFKATIAGGNRYTPVNIIASQQAQKVVYYDDMAFDKQYKIYHRLDAKIAYKINQKKIAQSFFISVENLMNTKNILREYYDPKLGKVKTEYQFGLFPYGGYRIEF